jgi:hypothetical protein
MARAALPPQNSAGSGDGAGAEQAVLVSGSVWIPAFAGMTDHRNTFSWLTRSSRQRMAGL